MSVIPILSYNSIFPPDHHFFKYNSACQADPRHYKTAIAIYTLMYINSNLSCKYCMHRAHCLPVIMFMPQLWTAGNASVIFFWCEHININTPVIRQISTPFLPNTLKYAPCSIQYMHYAPSVGISDVSGIIRIAQDESFEIMARMLSYTCRAAHTPHQYQKYRITPSDCTDIDHGCLPYLTNISDILKPLVLLLHIITACFVHRRA